MLARGSFLLPALLAIGALPACLLDAGPFEGASDYTSLTGGDGGGGGRTTTSTSQGGGGATGGSSTGGTTTSSSGGSTATGGTSTGGTTTSSTGGTGGAPIDGDTCPGKATTVAVYSKAIIDGDTTPAKDDYSVPVCGGNMGPDVVHAITALSPGRLTVLLEPEMGFAGFIHLRSTCDDASPTSQLGCAETQITIDVVKDQVVYVIVDGHANGGAGVSASGSYQLQVSLDGCGNGLIETNYEECDDGNFDGGDHCVACKVVCDTAGSITNDGDLFVHPTSHHCYMLSFGPDSNWQSAANDCVAWGGTLAAETTLQEIADLQGLRNPTLQEIWIGADDKQQDQDYVWATGEDWTYTNGQAPWRSGEPNGGMGENCIEQYKNGELNDDNCSNQENWLCERAPDGVPAP